MNNFLFDMSGILMGLLVNILLLATVVGSVAGLILLGKFLWVNYLREVIKQ